jgi:hypothetical protein
MGSYRKANKVGYEVGIEDFRRLHSKWSQTFRYLSMRNSTRSRISAVRPTWNNVISPKPLIVSMRANIRWKEEKVFYNPSIHLMVISPLEQFQI